MCPFPLWLFLRFSLHSWFSATWLLKIVHLFIWPHSLCDVNSPARDSPNPWPLQWKYGVLTTELPEQSQKVISSKSQEQLWKEELRIGPHDFYIFPFINCCWIYILAGLLRRGALYKGTKFPLAKILKDHSRSLCYYSILLRGSWLISHPVEHSCLWAL